jgi:hypothetical protein
LVSILHPWCEPWASGKSNGLKKPWWRTSGGTQKSTKTESKNNCKKRDGRQVGERKKQLKINPKTIKNH